MGLRVLICCSVVDASKMDARPATVVSRQQKIHPVLYQTMALNNGETGKQYRVDCRAATQDGLPYVIASEFVNLSACRGCLIDGKALW